MMLKLRTILAHIHNPTLEFRALFYLFSILIFTSCASSQLNSQTPKESFITQINSEGIRLFSYSLSIKSSTKLSTKGGHPSGGMGGGRPSHATGGGRPKDIGTGRKTDSRSWENAEESINTRLDTKLTETGFCPNGYTELDRYLGSEHVQIRGQCKASTHALNHQD